MINVIPTMTTGPVQNCQRNNEFSEIVFKNHMFSINSLSLSVIDFAKTCKRKKAECHFTHNELL